MTQTSNEIKYLLFDVESVPDGLSIASTRYPNAKLSPEEALKKFRFELLQESGRDFVPYTYHVPIAIVIAKIREDFSLAEIVSLDEPHHRPATITKMFWKGWERYGRPTLVTFNGRSFDLPLMELSAYRYGVGVQAWFNIYDKAFEQYRNRYNVHSHLDLHETLTNFGSSWFRGGLNLAAQLIGKPGKIDVQGDMVQELFAAGRLTDISEYCRCDVLDTYFVFLRTMVVMGKISVDQENRLTTKVREILIEQSSKHPAYKTYLEHWNVLGIPVQD
ncbi:MAG: 3'-5' exonuclease [Planctomycetes bacterium]|nr:3'-5' exonuclease [Planctomycetota bacterium]